MILEPCHHCSYLVNIDTDAEEGWYEDSFGRWVFCQICYVHAPHPADKTFAWWYAVERLYEINRSEE